MGTCLTGTDALVMGHREIELKLNWKFPLHYITCAVPGGYVKVTKGEKLWAVSSACELCKPRQ